jgi:hypothetical protein
MLKQAAGAAPIYEGSSRRWLIRNLSIALGLGFAGGELYWNFYELPRRKQRDDYFKSIGVEWKKLI